MPTIIQLFKSKTLIFAAFLAALSVVQGYITMLPITPTQQMYVGVVVSVAIAVLRVLTSKPLDEK
jgi:hypothetical protein